MRATGLVTSFFGFFSFSIYPTDADSNDISQGSLSGFHTAPSGVQKSKKAKLVQFPFKADLQIAGSPLSVLCVLLSSLALNCAENAMPHNTSSEAFYYKRQNGRVHIEGDPQMECLGLLKKTLHPL